MRLTCPSFLVSSRSSANRGRRSRLGTRSGMRVSYSERSREKRSVKLACRSLISVRVSATSICVFSISDWCGREDAPLLEVLLLREQLLALRADLPFEPAQRGTDFFLLGLELERSSSAAEIRCSVSPFPLRLLDLQPDLRQEPFLLRLFPREPRPSLPGVPTSASAAWPG